MAADEPFFSQVSSVEIEAEKRRAGKLRRSQWWKRRRAAGRCYYCDSAVRPSELTMDHLVPLVRGGKTVKGNVVPACKECNNQKRHALPWEGHADE